MGFKTGIVGMPNVGKSTLFNALTKTAAAQAANFPFCTIEPNTGVVAVPDVRLDKLAAIAGSKQILPAQMTFVDIAGLVKGASKGEGLGNKFLATIRECDAIAHVLRCFEDDDVTHVDGRVNPVEDAETIETELMLADLESIEKRLVNIVRKVRGGDKEAVDQERLMNAAKAALEDGKPARTVEIDADDRKTWEMLQLLTSKAVLYVCNVEEENAANGNATQRLLRRWPRNRALRRWLFLPQLKKKSVSLMQKKPKCSLKKWAYTKQVWIALSRRATDYFTCKPISPLARKRPAHGQFITARRHHKLRA